MPAGQWVAFEGVVRHNCARIIANTKPVRDQVAQPAPRPAPSNPEFEDFTMPADLAAGRQPRRLETPLKPADDYSKDKDTTTPDPFQRYAPETSPKPTKVDRRLLWWLIGGGAIAIFAATRRK